MRSMISQKLQSLIMIAIFITALGFQQVAAVEGLTTEQKLEDFRYLYHILKDDYPFFEVKNRVYNVDWLAQKSEFETMITNTTTDREFEQVLKKILNELRSWHTTLLDYNDYQSSLTVFKKIGNDNPWVSVLTKPEVVQHYQQKPGQDSKVRVYNNSLTEKPRYQFNWIQSGAIAYLKINKFDKLKYVEDHKPIYRFLESIKDYPVLIIDVRQNGGGAQQYWKENLVAPLINQELKAEYYGFIRGGSYVKSFYQPFWKRFSPIEQLNPELAKRFPSEVVRNFKNYYQIVHAVSPVKPVGFHGKIYLLVDNGSYSSADTFASFSRATKFAVVVGERTKGDGINNPVGIDMPLLALPNSGLVVRFPVGLGFNPDGSVNEEKATEPDIQIKAPIADTPENDPVIRKVIEIATAVR